MIAWIFVILCLGIVLSVIIWSAEAIIAIFFGTPPELPSGRKMRRAVINEIKQYYPNSKTILDIGSGFGGMALKISRTFKSAKVTGIERMPVVYICSKIFTFIWFRKNLKLKWQKFDKFIVGKKFDVGVSYSGPSLMKDVTRAFKENKFGVVISIDFPMPDIKPTREIKLHKDNLGQHVLYVYQGNNQVKIPVFLKI